MDKKKDKNGLKYAKTDKTEQKLFKKYNKKRNTMGRCNKNKISDNN